MQTPALAIAASEDALFLICLIITGTFSNELRCAPWQNLLLCFALIADLSFSRRPPVVCAYYRHFSLQLQPVIVL
jgi:hypothetical protein